LFTPARAAHSAKFATQLEPTQQHHNRRHAQQLWNPLVDGERVGLVRSYAMLLAAAYR